MAAIFADNIFKFIFLYQNCFILIQISLKYVLIGPINDKASLAQIMAPYQTDDRPLSEPMMVLFTDTYTS